ncbi:MAG: SIMPL domain-containing protein [Candidatus Pacearchaeota archaeon]|nr:SIMPL domain-containing protein [Candidatus Pacearchaeota archaeon]
METSVKITLIIVAAIILVPLIIYGLINSSQGNTITTQGQAQIKAMPDIVKVYFNADTQAKTAQEAKDKNAEIVDLAITNLVKAGFERAEIVTENFNVYPEYSYNYDKQEITGYRATHSLKVEFSTSKVDKIGEAIDAGVNAGAGISYINFELSREKENQYKAEALKFAGEDARNKAEAMASGLGKKISGIKSISDSSFNYYPWRVYGVEDTMGNVAEAKQAATSIQPGNQEVNAQVSVVFKIR